MDMRTNATQDTGPDPVPGCRWNPGSEEDQLDFEAALSLRITLCPLFHRSRTWEGLARRLRMHGLCLRADEDGLHLDSRDAGHAVCHTDLVGYSRPVLEERFGMLNGTICVI